MQSALERVVWGQSSADNIAKHALWGLSPARDLLPDASPGPRRILLTSPGDVRHIIRTLSRRKTTDPIEFYVHDSVELHARHLLLLRIAVDWALPIKQRAAAWLEVFGNALIQERTERYVTRLGDELLDMEDVDVDLSRLKYRERDGLARAVETWKKSDFPVKELWDRRVRATLGARYDHRDGVFDWDYRTGLERLGGRVVHIKQYKHWRETGVAFEFGDQQYTRPNPTLATFTQGIMTTGKAKGQKREIRGYWGDTVVGPYVAVGIQADDAPSLFDLVDKGTGTERNRHNAAEVAVYNLVADLWRIETGQDYAMTDRHQIYSGLGNDSIDLRHHALARANAIIRTFDSVTIVPISGDIGAALAKTALQQITFDVAFVGVNTANLVESSSFRAALKPGATVYAETAKFLIPLHLDQRHLFVDKVHAMASDNGLTPRYATKPRPPSDDADDLLGDCATVPVDRDTVCLVFATPTE